MPEFADPTQQGSGNSEGDDPWRDRSPRSIDVVQNSRLAWPAGIQRPL